VPDSSDLWFADRPGVFLVFRVNRRPLPQDNLFAPGALQPVFEHFKRVLTPGWEIVTVGKGHRRTWKVGGVVVEDDHQLLTGKLGWLPSGETVVPDWSQESMDWTSSTATPQGGRVMPFGFDGESRILTVLFDRSSAAGTIATVFERVLRENEAELLDRTVEWSVEPVLDSEKFVVWLKSLDVVSSVSFTARLPNPEPMDAFDDLYQRLRRSRATEITESLRSDNEAGLVEVEQDPDFRQAIAMGEQGFATLRGVGQRDTVESKYSQTDRVARERVDEVPPSWPEVFSLIRRLLTGSLRRFLEERDPA
jgi:hypothetical protein